MPLGKMASELRVAVDPAMSPIGLYTRALVALLRRTPDKGVVSMGANISPSRDFMLSSQRNQEGARAEVCLGSA